MGAASEVYRTTRLTTVAATTLRWLDRIAGRCIRCACCVLMIAAFALGLVDVVSSVARRSIPWSGDMESFVVLALAMSGAAIGVRRGTLVRLGSVSRRVPSPWGERIEVFAWCVVAAFAAFVASEAARYAAVERSVRAAVLAAGGVAMLAAAVGRVRAASTAQTATLGFGAVTMCIGLLWWARPVLARASDWAILPFLCVLLPAAIAAGVPFAVALAVAAGSYGLFGTELPSGALVAVLDDGTSHPALLSIPLFIALGLGLGAVGAGRAFVDLAVHALAKVRGGVAFGLLGLMWFASGVSPMKTADMALVASAVFPELRRRGASSPELAAFLAASAPMCQTLAPTLVLVTAASLTGVSIASLFSAGIIPALVLAAMLSVCAAIRNPPSPALDIAALRPLRAVLPEVAGIMALAFMLRAAVIANVFDDRAAAALAIFALAVVAAMRRSRLTLSALYRNLVDAGSLAGGILLMVLSATVLAWALLQSSVAQHIEAWIVRFDGSVIAFMIVSILAFVVTGSFLEGLPAIALLGPVFVPIAQHLGIDLVQYTLVIVLAVGVGLFSPPFGFGFYTACAIGGVAPGDVAGRMWPYFMATVSGIALIALVPLFMMHRR